MLFNSIPFLAFFPLVVFVYFFIPSRFRYIWLFIASIYFISSWDIRFVLFLLITASSTYTSGLLLKKSDLGSGFRYLVLISCLTLNFGILFFFKYINFALEILDELLNEIGISCIHSMNIIMPIGISFYTFQAISYVIDVFRNDAHVERNFIKYALYVSFFPTILSGPIERSNNLLTQIDNLHSIHLANYKRVVNGLITMLYGYFLKMVIADRIAILVDTVYENYIEYGALEIISATLAYAVQIYCDFLSYSTIALGAALVMGIRLTENFNTPYFSKSIKEFWRRWHISLSTWLRDYVYIPLGGSRHAKTKKYANIIITFFVSGLWHGANWTFVIWGLLHGVYQILEDLFAPAMKNVCLLLKIDEEKFGFKVIKSVYTFLLVDFAWMFFRANSVKDVMGMIRQACKNINYLSVFTGALYNLGLDNYELIILIIGVVTLFLVDWLRYKNKKGLADELLDQNFIFRWAIIIYLSIMIIVFGVYGIGYDPQEFIYLNF